MKRFYRVLSAFLCVALLVPMLVTTAIAASPDTMQIDTTEPVQDISVTFDVATNNIYDVDGNSHIKLQFNTAISVSEIEKVKITALSSGEALSGKWQGGAQQWEFIPYDIQDATYYTIVVPGDLFAENGLQMNEAVAHTFRTAPGTTENAAYMNVVNHVASITCLGDDLPARSASGHEWSGSVYGTSGEGFIINLQTLTSAYNTNQNIRFNVFDKIWQDPSYIGKTVRVSFNAKATDATNANAALSGDMKLSLTQTGTGNKYVWGTGFGGLDETVNLTNEFQTFTCEFTVTQSMYDGIADGTIASPGLALALRFPGFTDGTSYNDVKVTFNNFDVRTVAAAADSTLRAGEDVYFEFADKDYSIAQNLSLRFAVKNGANATVGIYAATHTTVGNKLGEVNVNGAGIYSINVTDYVKNCSGAPVFALKVEGSESTVDLASTLPMLSIITADTYDVLPTVSSSVVSTNPGGAQSGLWISGGQSDTDSNDSAKSYIKLSLVGYTGGYAGFLFSAMSEGPATVSVYGVADVNAGQSWTPDSLTLTNAPANDVYGSGVNINEVYGNASLATFGVGNYSDTYRIDLTEFAEHMLSKGATEITLILVSNSESETSIQIVDKVDTTIIAKYNCVTTKPGSSAAGYDKINLSFNSNSFVIDMTNTGTPVTNTGANVRINIFDEIWKDRSFIGKTIKFTFSAKASEEGSIGLTLNQRQKYAFTNFPGLSETADLTTNWQTFSFTFEVTEEMYSIITNGDDPNGIEATGLALGVRFNDFADGSAYSDSQIYFNNFVISETTPVIPEEIVTKIDEFDCVNKGFSVSASGYTLDESTYKFNEFKGTGYGLQLDLRAIGASSGINDNQNVRLPIFDGIWADSKYIGQTITFTFQAKASEAGSIKLALNQHGNGNYVWGDGWGLISANTELTTEWQTYTYEFVVTEEMFDAKNHSTSSTPNIALGVRFTGFLNDSGTYKGAQLNFRNFVISTVEYTQAANEIAVANVDEGIATIAEESFDRVFSGVEYDFSTNLPEHKTWGYHPGQIGNIVDGEYVVDLSKHQSEPNANQVALVGALTSILNNSAYIGKTFTVSFRARATEAGMLDFAINYDESLTIFDNCTMQCDLGTQYRTFTYTFTITQAMYNEDLVCGFRFYNGFKNGSTYKNAKIYIDDIRVYQDFFIDKTTLSVLNSSTVSNTGVSDKLTVSADTSATSAAISKSYLAYDLTTLTGITEALLKLNLSGANGETVRVYLIKNTTLPGNLTYDNAPEPIGAAVLSFTAVNGEIILDLTNFAIENEGTNIVLVFSIEYYSGNVQITNTDLDVTVNTHDYTSEEQRHVAVAPTYNAPGNIEFYTCTGCAKLYVKNGEDFVEVDSDSVILPPVEYKTEISSISLNIGKDLTMRYHVVLTAGEDIDDFALNFTLEGKPTVTVTEYTYDAGTGMYIFSFTGIAPQLMGDIISSELVKNGQVIDQGDYSVRQYVEKALELYPNDQALKQLLADLMHYGAAAQQYIGYKTDSLVTDGLGLSASSATPTDADKKKGVSQSTNSNVQFTAAGVRFDYVNRIYVKFKAADISGVTVSVGGVNLEILETNTAGVYIAYSDAISALRFSEVVTFTLSVNGSAVQTLTYTVNDYAYAKHSDSRISDLALALYRYGKSASNYDSSK